MSKVAFSEKDSRKHGKHDSEKDSRNHGKHDSSVSVRTSTISEPIELKVGTLK